MTVFHEYLSPFIELIVDVDLNRTYIAARTAERRCKWQVGVLFHIKTRREDGTDRACDCIVITVPTTASVHRTSIHARTASDAFQSALKIFTFQSLASAIVDQNDMHRLSGPWFPEVT